MQREWTPASSSWRMYKETDFRASIAAPQMGGSKPGGQKQEVITIRPCSTRPRLRSVAISVVQVSACSVLDIEPLYTSLKMVSNSQGQHHKNMCFIQAPANLMGEVEGRFSSSSSFSSSSFRILDFTTGEAANSWQSIQSGRSPSFTGQSPHPIHRQSAGAIQHVSSRSHRQWVERRNKHVWLTLFNSTNATEEACKKE